MSQFIRDFSNSFEKTWVLCLKSALYRHVKKVLALVLAFAMAFTMMATAGAAYTDQADIQATEAVDMLTALGIMSGDGDGSFRPNDTITRAEACRMIYTIRTNSDNADAYANMQTTFKDVPSDAWYAGYVKHCQAANIVSGTSATTFEPNRDVTGVELALMCLRVMGYDPEKADIGGSTWSTKTIGLATEAGLLDGVNTPITSACPRQWAAQIMYNTIGANTVEWSTDRDGYSDKNDNGYELDTVGVKYLKLYSIVGTLTSVDNKNLTISQTSSDKEDSDIKYDSNTTSFTNLDEDYSYLLGQKVKVMIYDKKTNDVVGVYATNDSVAYEVNASQVESDGNKVKIDGTSYSLESAEGGNDYIDVYYTAVDGTQYNNKEFKSQAGVTYEPAAGTDGFKAAEIFDDWDTSAATMSLIDNDNNGRLDLVIITDYTAAEVTSVTSSKLVAGKSYDFADENIDEDITADDWAVISWDRYGDCQRIQKADIVSGTVNGTKDDSTSENKLVTYDEYEIDDTWYNGATDVNNYQDLNTVKAGNSVDAAIVNGVVYMIKRTSGSANAGDLEDVAMIVNKDSGIGGDQVKLQFFNDTTAVVDVDSDSDVSFDDLQFGALYEYSVSGGEYSFESYTKDTGRNSVLSTEDDYYGDYTYEGSLSYSIGDSTLGKTIDDKAKVILYTRGNSNTSNDSDVLTGKQFKGLDWDDVLESNTSVTADYFTADMDGLNRTAAIAVTVDKLPTSTDSNDFYGYILSDAVNSGNNEVRYELLTEDGETITVYERNTNRRDRVENTLIGYSSLSDENSDGKRYIDDVHLYDLSSDADVFALNAITEKTSNNDTVQFAQAIDGTNEFDIVSDTVIFFVDTDDKTGSTEGTIRVATDWYDDAEGAKITDGADAYIANCLAVRNAYEDELEVLVVESGDNQFRGAYTDEYNENNQVNETVAIASSYTGITDVADSNGSVLGKNVDKGTSLTVTVAGVTGLQTKVTVTGGTISGSDTVTGTAQTVTVVVDGSASKLGISTSMVDGKIAKVPVTSGVADITSWTVTTGVGTKKLSDGDVVNVGETVTVKVTPDSAVAAGKTYTVDLMNGTTKLGTATFTYGDATAKEITFQMPETDATGITLTLKATVETATVEQVSITGVKYLDEDGYETTTAADVRGVEITFSKAVDKTAAETTGNYSVTGGSVNVSAASLNSAGTVVTLTVDNLTSATELTISNVVATDGGTLTGSPYTIDGLS